MSILFCFKLDKKVVLITGGCGHLGKSISKGLAEAGAIVIVGQKDPDKYYRVFGEQKYSNISVIELNVSSPVSIKNAYEKIQKKYGKIDVLINNAFYSKGNFPEKITNEEWNYGIDGTLNSVFRCVKEVLPYMRKAKKGNIINIASMYGVVSPDFKIYENNPEYFNAPNYGVAKAGVIQFTKYYAVYLAKYNIRVNCISPGAFPSIEVQKSKGFIEKLSKKIPMGRIGNPDDLKGVIVFLSSDASSYVTGQNIIVDGGWTLC
ncbi:MAG: SDR family oxidoreductase [bacterium]|nr:SDR family oxidoreductase [bacterium]